MNAALDLPAVSAVTITDGFWKSKLDVIRKVTVDDVLTKFEREGRNALRNFERVRDGKTGGHEGSPWWDGLIYETIRAASERLGFSHQATVIRINPREPRIDAPHLSLPCGAVEGLSGIRAALEKI